MKTYKEFITEGVKTKEALAKVIGKEFQVNLYRGYKFKKIKDVLIFVAKFTGNMSPEVIKNTAQGDQYIFSKEITIVNKDKKSSKKTFIIQGVAPLQEEFIVENLIK
jgi:hypothetical protein